MPQLSKHILIVAHHYPPHITGVGMVAYNQAKRLAVMGHSVTVVTSETNKYEKSAIIDGVKVIRIKAWNFLEKWDIPFPLFSPRLLAVLLREAKKADIVHIHDVFYMSSFLAALCARWYHKIIVLTQHIALIVHPSKIVVAIEKIAYATTGAIIFTLSDSIMVYNDTVELFLVERNVPASKIIRLMNGVDGSIFHPVTDQEKRLLKEKLGLSPDKKIVLFVGRFVYKKGFTKVLAARSSNYQLVFAGGNATEENSEDVVFVGKLHPDEIVQVYQAADIFILPSESEGFPLSIQEAMSCGLPIISTNDRGYDRYLLDKKNVCLIDSPTDASVRAAIEGIVFDDTRLAEMGEYSRAYAAEHFNWDVLVGQLTTIYDALLHKKMTTRPRKIAFVSDAIYQFNKGGKEKRLYDITTRLAEQGYDVTIYCMKWWQGPKVLKKDNVTLYAISPYYPLYHNDRRSIRQAIYFSLHCFKLISQSFDIMDVDHIPHLVLFVTKVVAVLKGKKMIVTWHEVWGRKYWQSYLGTFSGFLAYMVEKISATLPNKIVAVSPHTTNELKKILGVKKEIITIPNAIDIELIKNATPGMHSDILFAGRLLPNKNIDVLLKAVVIMKKNNPAIAVCIVGEGPQKEYLEKLTSTLGLEENVRFTGFVERQEELYSMMQSSKVFVLPSSREGFGITVIEANAAGLPVVTVDAEHNAAQDLIIDNENGAVCALNEVSLAGTIEQVLRSRKDPEFYMQYAEKYSWKETIGTIEKLYI
jgi:glycosyltransferase involved in cell wall biosynthesis